MVCAPHRVKLQDLAALEVAAGAVVDNVPISLHALWKIGLEMREVVRSTDGDLHRRHRIKRVATIRGAQAEAETDRVVASLGGDDDADLFTPPIANILEDSAVRRISHSINDDVGFYRKVKNVVR